MGAGITCSSAADADPDAVPEQKSCSLSLLSMSCFSASPVPVIPETPQEPDNVMRSKVRPLLCDLEQDFAEFAGADGQLDALELEQVWRKCAERKCGVLSDDEARLIHQTARMYLTTLDVDKSGKISYAEFATYMLGGLDSRGELQNLRNDIQKSIQKDSAALRKFISRFKQWDIDGDGFVTVDELSKCLQQIAEVGQDAPGELEPDERAGSGMCCLPRLPGRRRSRCSSTTSTATSSSVDDKSKLARKGSGHSRARTKRNQKVSSGKTLRCDDGSAYFNSEASAVPKELTLSSKEVAYRKAEMLIEEMDVDGDDRVDLWELIAHTLGRRKTPVELLLYDISKGVSETFRSVLLGKKFEAVYHTGVLVFGKEYWYGGRIFKTQPPCTEIFGMPLMTSVTNLTKSSYVPELSVCRVGSTLATPKEFEDFLRGDVCKSFTNSNYDVLTHNCNHFANEAVKFLTGDSIPSAVLALPEMLMKSPTVKLLRPLLNRWLGGMGSDGDDEFVETDNIEAGFAPNANDVCNAVCGSGNVVVVDMKGTTCAEQQLGCILKDEGGSMVQAKVFDPATSSFIERPVDKADIIRKAI